MNTIKTIAAAALVSVAAIATPATASVNPFASANGASASVELFDATIAPELASVAAASSVEELIEDLKDRRDDGTLNAQDHFKLRQARQA